MWVMKPSVSHPFARLAKWTGYAALGPITGPLVAGFVRHRKSAPLLAALYAVAIPSVWLGLASTLGLLKAAVVQ
jgi:hypothetical protein